MTPVQQATFDYITEYTTTHGKPPTTGEIGKRFNISYRAAMMRCKQLERRGLLRDNGQARRFMELTQS